MYLLWETDTKHYFNEEKNIEKPRIFKSLREIKKVINSVDVILYRDNEERKNFKNFSLEDHLDQFSYEIHFIQYLDTVMGARINLYIKHPNRIEVSEWNGCRYIIQPFWKGKKNLHYGII